ncbi:MAG: dimethylsulfoniopropionate demethylase [Rhizobiales bacterium]|nr:dimethylsulfoniopropionate demethylase [Hyphomicrobiales bacterium]
MSTSGLNMSRRIRRTPYTDKVEQHGVRGFSVVNHMLLPKAFGPTVEEDFLHLREHVQIWDVSCQRQVEITGPDAARLVQWMTPRDLRRARIGQCLYVPLIDETAGMVNDPVLLKLAEDRFWLSIADSDVLLWAKGLAIGARLDVSVDEPDVSPLAVQGPKAEDLMASIFGEHVRQIRYFRFGHVDFRGTRQLVARTGYSRPGGFEIFLDDSALGPLLWDTIWQAGRRFEMTPGCPNLPDRIEAGLLSYGNEFTRANNPLECGMARYCTLDGSIDYIGREALEAIARRGIERQIRGVLFDGGPCPPCGKPWPVLVGATEVGRITSAGWSPRLQRNVGLSMIEKGAWAPGTRVTIESIDGVRRDGVVSALPFE